MKKRNVFLCALSVLLLAAVILAAIRIYQHEKDQNEALRELAERLITLQEEQQETAEHAASGENIDALRARITRLEVQADYDASDYRWLPIGNSITVHAPNEVWWNKTGMAASAADKDYVHLVAAFLNSTQGKTACHPFYFRDWEISPEHRAETLAMLDPYLDPRLNLVTIQLGENAEDLTTFEEDYEALIHYVQEKAPDARILVIGDFWTMGERDRMKQEAAANTGAEFVSLEEIRDRTEYQAGLGTEVYDPQNRSHTIENEDVARHPGDSGMQYIAGRIVEVISHE